MPNSTTIKIVEIELSALRCRAWLTSLISPVATWETSAITTRGSSAMTGLRKITSSRSRIKASVASRTIWSARALDCWLSSCWAADPVTPSASPVPAISGLMSARSALTASPAAVPEPLTTLLGMATSAVCTRRFGDGAPTVMPTTSGMCLLPSDRAIVATLAESAPVSGPPPARENTMMAAALVTWLVCGNAWSCRAAARIDS